MSVAEFNHSLITNAEFLMPFAFTLTHDRDKTQDLFQETILRALANKHKYHTGTNLKAWLYTIMRNIFINEYRRKSKQQFVQNTTSADFLINSTVTTTANSAIASINIKEIQKAIIALPHAFKDPFLLYFDGYKYNEISSMLCEPVGTIKSRIHSARKLLKVQIERF